MPIWKGLRGAKLNVASRNGVLGFHRGYYIPNANLQLGYETEPLSKNVFPNNALDNPMNSSKI